MRLSKKRILYLTAAVIGFLLSAVFFSYVLFITVFDSSLRLMGSPEIITKNAQYAETTRSLRPHWEETMAHFPSVIPKEATKVKFYYQEPDYRFGGPFILELRMRLPSEKIRSLQAQFQAKAQQQYLLNNQQSSLKTETLPDGSTITYDYFFHTVGRSRQVLTKDYDIYVLGDQRGASDDSGGYKSRYGVAIHEERLEIIYWLENS